MQRLARPNAAQDLAELVAEVASKKASAAHRTVRGENEKRKARGRNSMVSLIVVFWMYVILFATIGAMRGWARELLVAFSVILALFITSVVENFVPIIGPILASNATFSSGCGAC